MHVAHALRQHRVIVPEFGYHVERCNGFSIVVDDALETRNLPDGANGWASELPRPLGNGVRHRENLLALIVEHQMIVPEMRARHVPMEVLGFEIQRKHVGEQRYQRSRNVLNRFFRKGRGSGERRSVQHIGDLVDGWPVRAQNKPVRAAWTQRITYKSLQALRLSIK